MINFSCIWGANLFFQQHISPFVLLKKVKSFLGELKSLSESKFAHYLALVSYLKKRIQSFCHALRGWKWFLNGAHSKIQTFAGAAVVLLGFYLDMSLTHWAIICLCIGLVLSAEMFNSSLEDVCDELHAQQSKAIGRAKDMAAGPVLILSLVSAIIAALIFTQYL